MSMTTAILALAGGLAARVNPGGRVRKSHFAQEKAEINRLTRALNEALDALALATDRIRALERDRDTMHANFLLQQQMQQRWNGPHVSFHGDIEHGLCCAPGRAAALGEMARAANSQLNAEMARAAYFGRGGGYGGLTSRLGRPGSLDPATGAVYSASGVGSGGGGGGESFGLGYD